MLHLDAKIANAAVGSLAGGISANQGTLSVLGGEGAKFPTLATGEYFYITVTSAANPSNTEIMRVTARTADTMTIKQADGTARNLNSTFSAGDSVEVRLVEQYLETAFDIDEILPVFPTPGFRFYFKQAQTTSSSLGPYRYLGDSGTLATPLDGELRPLTYAIRSDGTNADFDLLQPSDISEDINATTSHFALPVRGHPWLPATESMYYYDTTAEAWAQDSITSFTSNTNSNKNDSRSEFYAHAEDHDLEVEQGSLVYLANVAKTFSSVTVSDKNAFDGYYGVIYYVSPLADIGTPQTLSDQFEIDYIRRSLNLNGSGSYVAMDSNLTPSAGDPDAEDVLVGAYIHAHDAEAIVPPHTYVKSMSYDASTSNWTMTLSNPIYMPSADTVAVYYPRQLQLGEEFSASTPNTVYYKRDAGAPVSTTINNSDTLYNTPQGSYQPVPGPICNVYTAFHSHSGGGQFTTTQHNISLDTSVTTLRHPSLSITVKPHSVNSVFLVHVVGNFYKNSGYGSARIVVDFMDNHPSSTNTRVYDNPNDNTTNAKACIDASEFMLNDRNKIVSFNGNAYNPGSWNRSDDPGTLWGRAQANGRPQPMTWPEDTLGNTRQPTSGPYGNVYYSGNIDGASGSTHVSTSPSYWHVNAHVHQGKLAPIFIRPGVTDKIRIQVYVVEAAGNQGTVYMPHSASCHMYVEEFADFSGNFGIDIEGGLDTTSQWNGQTI